MVEHDLQRENARLKRRLDLFAQAIGQAHETVAKLEREVAELKRRLRSAPPDATSAVVVADEFSHLV
jgi:hypothetical protein